MKRIILIFGLVSSFVIHAQEINIIPQPVEMKVGKGDFIITNKTVITYTDQTKFIAEYLKKYIKEKYGIELPLTMHNRESKKGIYLMYGGNQGKIGFYSINIEKDAILIGGDDIGVFYGVQTLIQLLPISDFKPQTSNIQLKIPQLEISDYPRFPYRGMHLDVCRHFFPVSFVKKYIDYLAYHKLNIFHWHLTEDQGWRIEIKKYPELTKIGSWRNGTIIGRYPGTGNDNIPYGGFYTQEEIKEVVQYAKERFIEVIPEIEMPGHGSAAIAAYPWLSCFPEKPTAIPANMISNKSVEEQNNGRIKLVQETWGVFDDIFCAGKDSTFLFLQNLIDEVIPLFPSKYFHIGGDEAPKTHWKICPRCQQRIKELGLKDEHELQSWFVQRIEKYLNSKGKTLIGWDEILEGGLAPNAVVMSWRGEAGGIAAAKDKHLVIMTPGNPLYFDHSQSDNEDSVTIGGYNPIEKVYAYEPVPKELTDEQGKYILGAQANLWTEYISNEKKIEYMLLPRLAALSEILWSPKESRNWESFEKRLRKQMKRYDNWGVNYSKAYYDLRTKVIPALDFNGIRWVATHFYPSPSRLIFSIRQKYDLNFTDTLNVYDINDPTKIVDKVITDSFWYRLKKSNLSNDTLLVKESGSYSSTAYKLKRPDFESFIDRSYPAISNEQKFHFSKATGKKITLTSEASKNYPGDGAFTLVNGVINEKGLARSKEFLGFSGSDCEAVIDLGKEETINAVTIHVLDQPNSWIYPPAWMKVYSSTDGIHFNEAPDAESTKAIPGEKIRNIKWDYFPSFKTRYLKVLIKNFGTIPPGNPGAGNKAWLFVDEIEVN